MDDVGSIEKKLIRVSLPPFEEFFSPTFHADSSANQIRSVVGRVLGVVPKPTTGGIALLTRVAALWSRTLSPTVQDPLDEMPNRYTGGKRSRYLAAYEAICVTGATVRDSYCNAFVKPERFDGYEKRDPDPRAIQFRGPKFCVELASYLHPIEQQLYITKFGSAGVPPSRNIAKGLNQQDRAMLLRAKLANFDSPVVLSLDASRFDKHVSQELLVVEHGVYKACNRSRRFAALLALQLVNKVFSKLGFKYTARGRRMSGDMNTALGNCVLMLVMIVAYLTLIRLGKFDTLDDGDDCLLIIEERDLELVSSTIFAEFLNFGMEMKVEGVSRSLASVVFCRSSPVEYAPGLWKFVRNYRDVVSKALTGIRHWDNRKYRDRVIKAIGTCELALNSGVPVLQAFALALLRNTEGEAFDSKYLPNGLRIRFDRELRAHSVKPLPIQECGRESFETAFGVPFARQIELEAYFDTLVFSKAEIVFWGREWDNDWIVEQSFIEREAGQNAESTF